MSASHLPALSSSSKLRQSFLEPTVNSPPHFGIDVEGSKFPSKPSGLLYSAFNIRDNLRSFQALPSSGSFIKSICGVSHIKAI
ncbi:hypothetical protein VNO77_42121 [Canavalia gladiata]|uniref:Uncharacterized protein n=1 Tax=Canavalia gladiata TaxID=3824 RepID=A0AAN9K116_CANGL